MIAHSWIVEVALTMWLLIQERQLIDVGATMHVGIANTRWRGKRSRHAQRMRNPQFCVSGKRPIGFKINLQNECFQGNLGIDEPQRVM